MYRLNIENIYENKVEKRNNIIKGGGKQFKVYRATDINTLLKNRYNYTVVEYQEKITEKKKLKKEEEQLKKEEEQLNKEVENKEEEKKQNIQQKIKETQEKIKETEEKRKEIENEQAKKIKEIANSIQEFTDSLTIHQLCDYYFSYIMYDTLDDDFNMREYLLGIPTGFYESIQKKLLTIFDIANKTPKFVDVLNKNGDVKEYKTTFIEYNSDSKDRIAFCEYISELFDIQSGEQNINLPDIDNFFDNTKIVLSEGQYLKHLDNIYERYKNLILDYEYRIDMILSDLEQIELHIYEEEKRQILEKKNTDNLSSVDQKYWVLHVLFFDTSNKSYLLKIDEKYKILDTIKEKNIFYNNDKIFIKNKSDFLKNIKKKIETNETFKGLRTNNGIEKLLNIYYAYIPNENSFDTDINDVFKNLCEKISDFFINNQNIYNLLLFNDTIFENMMKNELIITLYDEEPKLPHKFGLIEEDDNSNIIFNLQDGYVIDIETIKQIMLYRYKNIETAIRTKYLNKYNYKEKKIIINNTSAGTSVENYSAPTFKQILKNRMKINRKQISENTNFIKKMVKVMNFYRKGRLVNYKNVNKSEDQSKVYDEFIGIITTDITDITDLTTLKILPLSQIKEHEEPSTPPISVGQEYIDIDIEYIYETKYILCKNTPSTSKIQGTGPGPGKSWCPDEKNVTYEDMDLFDKIYDEYVYTIKKKIDLKDLPKNLNPDLSYEPDCLVDRDEIIVKHKHFQKKQDQPQNIYDTDEIGNIEVIAEVDVSTETYVSIYKINNKQLENKLCFFICQKKFNEIIEILKVKVNDMNPTLKYINQDYCLLIEKVKDKVIIKEAQPYDTLFFIDQYIKEKIKQLESNESSLSLSN